MSYGPNASKEYLKNTVLTASPEQLQLMLFDGAIRFASRGAEALRAVDYEGAFNALDRAQKIVLELTNGLNRDVNPELVDKMASLYNFIYRRLVDANMHRDVSAIDDALRILRHQRETWVLLMEKVSHARAVEAADRAAAAAQDASAESKRPQTPPVLRIARPDDESDTDGPAAGRSPASPIATVAPGPRPYGVSGLPARPGPRGPALSLEG